MTKKDAFISNELKLQNHPLTFIHKNKSFLSASSDPFFSPMAHNTTATLDKPTCLNYVDFGKRQDRFGQFFRSKKQSKYLDVKLNVFKKDDNKDLQLVQVLTMGEADLKQFMRLRSQLVLVAENFHRGENLYTVLIPTMSKHMVNKSKWLKGWLR